MKKFYIRVWTTKNLFQTFFIRAANDIRALEIACTKSGASNIHMLLTCEVVRKNNFNKLLREGLI